MKISLSALAIAGVLAVSSLAQAKDVHGSWALKGATTETDVNNVKTALQSVPGVMKPTVTKTSVRLTYDDAKTDEAKIASAVSSAGSYSIVAKGAKSTMPKKTK